MNDTALVSRSKFEDLIVKIRDEEEMLVASELNQNRQRDLLKSICSVYFFLRKVAGMARRGMTLEEFEIAEEKLKELAQEAMKKSRHKILGAIGFKTAWSYYAKFGYFHIKRTPFGRWWNWHNWIRRGWGNFNPDEYIKKYSDCYSTPPNAEELLDKLFKKRFGEKIDTRPTLD